MNVDGMTGVDYALIGIIVLSGLIGLVRGLVQEALSLIAWVAAVWMALSFSQQLAPLLSGQIATESVRIMVAFATLFLVTLIFAAVANYLIGQLVDKTGLSGTDHLLGVVFGVVRGVAVIALLVLLAGATTLPQSLWWKQSSLIWNFQTPALWLRDFLPADIAEKFIYQAESGPVADSTAGFSFPLHSGGQGQAGADSVTPASP